MSRTHKDKREEKVKRTVKPELKASYRKVINSGFLDNYEHDHCPECGAIMNYDQGFLSCEECSWGSFFPDDLFEDRDLEFSSAA